MHEIYQTDVIWYHNGIEVFSARDPVGGSYVGVIAEEKEFFDRYLVVGVCPEKLRQFRVGLLDLRTLVLETPLQEWYLADTSGPFGVKMPLVRQDCPLPDSPFLPPPDFVLKNPPVNNVALEEARKRHSLVFEFSVMPRESLDGHSVGIGALGNLLSNLEKVIKYSYQRALRELPANTKKTHKHVQWPRDERDRPGEGRVIPSSSRICSPA